MAKPVFLVFIPAPGDSTPCKPGAVVNGVECRGSEEEAHGEGEAGAGGLNGKDSGAQVAVVLEVIDQGLPGARLHAPVNAHVLGLRPASDALSGKWEGRRFNL